MQKVSRRRFLKGAGAATLALSLIQLGCWPESGPRRLLEEEVIYRGWEDVYRRKWTWDRVTWGSHHVDCYPGNCSWRVYSKNGLVFREEQAGVYPEVEAGVPDMNPRGCQKGCTFSEVMYGAERLQHPLKRVGERGEGKWVRVSWDEALTEVADGVLDAIAEVGPESIVYEFGGGAAGGIVNGPIPAWRLGRLIGGTILDINGMTSDFNVGLYQTFGKFQFVSSVDDWFHADLIIIWHMNPLYTRIPSAHYLTEARYKGTDVISIAPDYNASSIHTDLWVPVEPGTDAALALAMCKVIVDEGRYDAAFVKEQTDLPLLVRLDTKRFLRAPDLPGGEAARDDQFYFFDAGRNELLKAPRGTLRLPGDPALEGTFEVTLADGSQVQVTPAFELMKETLKDYTPEAAATITKVTAKTIRNLADRVASAKRVHLLQGWSVNKYYHGDLMERAMALLVALTGNLGRKGTGMRGWNTAQLYMVPSVDQDRIGLEGFMGVAQRARDVEEEFRAKDPTVTEEMVAMNVEREEARRSAIAPVPMSALSVPAVFFWYWHGGYKEVWNRREWSDQTMARSFDDYFQEAVDSGWWEGLMNPGPDKTPQVLFEVGVSTLRRTRGGFKQLRRHLWPNLKKVVTVDVRMSTTALFSDIVLPGAAHYEKVDFRFPTAHVPFLTFIDRAVHPVGEAKPEWEIFALLAKKIEERARRRELGEYQDVKGKTYSLDNLYDVFTFHGAVKEDEHEKLAEDMVLGTVRVGALPERTTLETLREEGIAKFTGLGADAPGLNLATDIRTDETLSPLKWHVQRKIPYPTLTRRIQFYIDHDWFLEAGEELPVHKPNPHVGGDYPIIMNGGHLRWSIHSTWVANKVLLRTYRGGPSIFVNPKDARRKGIEDDDEVRVFNDFGSFHVRARITPSVRPGEVIMYNGWEPYQYRNWKPMDAATPGMIKWLHLAGGYGHLSFWRNNWQPQQIDRAMAVDIEKA
jgi:DMSO reductase family type II enzyme molybdopterin subunit